MKVGVSKEEVLGYCESRWENDDKANALKEQIKAINADSTEMTKVTSKEFETKAKDLNKVYAHYKEMKKSGEEETDFYELMALLETAMEEDGSLDSGEIDPDSVTLED